MASGQRVRLLIALAAGILAAAAGGIVWWRWRAVFPPEAQYRRLPTSDAVVLYVDFDALRRGGVLGMLTGAKVAEEPEYQQFVSRTGFDYRRDLDTAMVAFTPGGKYFTLRGRFDWPRLRRYAEAGSGSCQGSLCRMSGSTAERRISFLPVRTGLMAMAVSPDDSAVLRISEAGPSSGDDLDLPSDPVWLRIPPAFLKSSGNLPTGTRMFARVMEDAQRVTLSLGPAGRDFAARLHVACRSERDAADLASQLQRATTMLRDFIHREHQKPNPADLSGVLSSGAFRAEGSRVHGYWPIQQAFIQNLLAGGTS